MYCFYSISTNIAYGFPLELDTRRSLNGITFEEGSEIPDVMESHPILGRLRMIDKQQQTDSAYPKESIMIGNENDVIQFEEC